MRGGEDLGAAAEPVSEDFWNDDPDGLRGYWLRSAAGAVLAFCVAVLAALGQAYLAFSAGGSPKRPEMWCEGASSRPGFHEVGGEVAPPWGVDCEFANDQGQTLSLMVEWGWGIPVLFTVMVIAGVLVPALLATTVFLAIGRVAEITSGESLASSGRWLIAFASIVAGVIALMVAVNTLAYFWGLVGP